MSSAASLNLGQSQMVYYPFPKQALVFTCLQYKPFENTVGKGEIARNEQFLLFPQCFLPFWRALCHFNQIRNCRLQPLAVLKSLKFVVWERVKEWANTNIYSTGKTFISVINRLTRTLISDNSCHRFVYGFLLYISGILSMYEGHGDSRTKSLMFEKKITDMTQLLNRQLEIYKAEEDTLKVKCHTFSYRNA